MNSETLKIEKSSSATSEIGGLIISVREASYGSGATIVVGRPGAPSVVKKLQLADAMLADPDDEGLVEIRLFKVSNMSAVVLVSRLAPNVAVLGGYEGDDPENTRFTEEEVAKIAQSVASVKRKVKESPGISDEKADHILRKLDEIQEASRRLGRKDWKNIVVGTLTSAAVNTALSADLAGELFSMVSDAFAWLFSAGIKLLPPI